MTQIVVILGLTPQGSCYLTTKLAAYGPFQCEMSFRSNNLKIVHKRFRYTISHVPAKDLIIADALSRAPSRNIEKSESDFENDTTAFVDMIMESFPASNNRLSLQDSWYT
jgi:hypothetical protein